MEKIFEKHIDQIDHIVLRFSSHEELNYLSLGLEGDSSFGLYFWDVICFEVQTIPSVTFDHFRRGDQNISIQLRKSSNWFKQIDEKRDLDPWLRTNRDYLHFSIAFGDSEIQLLGAGWGKNDDFYCFQEDSIHKLFVSKLLRPVFLQKIEQEKISFSQIEDETLQFRSLPDFDCYIFDKVLLVQIHIEAANDFGYQEQFIRLKNVQTFKLTDYSQFDLGPGFEDSLPYYHLNLVNGSNWIQQLKKEYAEQGETFPEDLHHYILPVSNRNPGAEMEPNWIEIIAGEVEMINYPYSH